MSFGISRLHGFNAAPLTFAGQAALTATGGIGEITLTWDPVSGATGYNLYWARATGVTPLTGTKIAGVTSPYVHSGLEDGSVPVLIP